MSALPHEPWTSTQARIDAAEQTADMNDYLRADAWRQLTSDPTAPWTDQPSAAELAEDDTEWRRLMKETRA